VPSGCGTDARLRGWTWDGEGHGSSHHQSQDLTHHADLFSLQDVLCIEALWPQGSRSDEPYRSSRTHETDCATVGWDRSYGGVSADRGGNADAAVWEAPGLIRRLPAHGYDRSYSDGANGLDGRWRRRRTGSLFAQEAMLERRSDALTIELAGAGMAAVSFSPFFPSASADFSFWPHPHARGTSPGIVWAR
jgi:hypothetical protein